MKYYPLRPIQRWLIDTHFNKAKSTMMNIGALYKLSGQIDTQRLEDAINQVLEAHDIFHCRLTFHPETCDLCQTFDNEIFPVIVEEWTDEEFELITKYLSEPYDLIGKPLYRAYIFKTPSANYLYADFYHATMDGVSATILFVHELDAAYRGRKSKRKPLSYAEYVEAEANIPPEVLAEGHEYWEKMMAPFDPKKHLPPVDVEGVAAWTQGNFDYKIKNITSEFFRESHLSEHIYFLGASMMTLAKITGSRESIMSWIHNGRTTMRERRIMGLMLDQFPCAWDFHNDMTVEEFLNKLFGQTQISMTHRKSLGMVYSNGLEDDCVSFIFQKAFYDNMIVGDLPLEAVYLPPNEISAVENALDIEIEEDDKGIYSVFLDYDASRYSAASIKHFAETMDDILLAMKNPDTKISEILG